MGRHTRTRPNPMFGGRAHVGVVCWGWGPNRGAGMPTDTKDPCNEASGEEASPPASSEAELMPEVEALTAIAWLMESYEYYNAYMVEHVRPHAMRHIGDEGRLRCEFDRLCTFAGFCVLALTWKESDFITEENLTCPGLERVRKDKKITRHALGRALKALSRRSVPAEPAEKYARRAQRIVEAGITFGLIEPQEEGTKSLKPLRGTAKLHELMMEVGGAAFALFDPGD